MGATLIATLIATLVLSPLALAAGAFTSVRFVGYVQEADDFEMDSSTLALRRSESEAIRAYATRVLAERKEMALSLSGARGAAGVNVSMTRDGSRTHHTAVLDRLGTLQGGAFDDLYVRTQLADQTDVIAEVRAYAEDGDDGNLRHFAQEALLKLEAELDQARLLTAQ